MSLFVIATPIGHAKDISLRAIETLQAAEVVIGEEFKEVSKLLKGLDIKGKPLEVLNEHSTPDDIQNLLKLCQTKRVALVSDCGTPGFCDPGAALILVNPFSGLGQKRKQGAALALSTENYVYQMIESVKLAP